MSLPQQLLDTKTQIPPLPPHVVQRTQLLEVLDRSLEPDVRLTLVSAPAGYGKTTLVNSWVRHRRLPAAWLSLDERDNQWHRFLNYVLASLSRAIPDLAALGLPAGALAADEVSEQILAPLINRIGSIAQPTVLVLDDYHWIQQQQVHDRVTYLLENVPPQAHIILVTRADPPLPISLFRGRGQLNELRAIDLRFQPAEARSFLQTFEDLDLTEEQIERLAGRTEGWVSGLQMAAASLRDREDKDAFVEAFSGSHRHVMDYLMDEVLRRQPAIIQSFLRVTCTVDRLSGPLSEALMQAAGEPVESGQAILQQLERDNLFIMPLDESRQWYRYHRLFADVLRARLQAERPDLAPGVYRAASEWFEADQDSDEAVASAFSTGDHAFAANCVERFAQAALLRGDTATFLRWVQRLPEAEVRRRPRLVIYRAWGLLFNGAPLNTIEAQLKIGSDASDPAGSVVALQAYLALSAGQVRRGTELADAALRGLPADEVYLRDFATLCAASGRMSLGDEEGSVRLLEQSIQASERSGNRAGGVIMLCELAELRFKQLRLDLSQDMLKQALDLARTEDGRLLPIGGRALIGLGDVALERYELDLAGRLLQEGIELCRRWGLLTTFNGYMSLSMLHLAKRDWDSLDQTLKRLHDLARRFDASEWDDAVVDMLEARFSALRGRHAAVHDWVERYHLDRPLPKTPPADETETVTRRLLKYQLPILARLHLAEGQIDAALVSIEAFDAAAREANRPFLQIEAGILRARAYHALGRFDDAIAALAEALKTAAPGGISRAFLEDQDVLTLLKAGSKRWPSPEVAAHVEILLAKAGVLRTATSAAPAGPVEPLSPREVEVLSLLSSDLTADEMAKLLAVSVNTIRTHLKNIYTKLNVHSRHEAVGRAHNLGLIKR